MAQGKEERGNLIVATTNKTRPAVEEAITCLIRGDMIGFATANYHINQIMDQQEFLSNFEIVESTPEVENQ
jgi:hypothetical protein